MFMEVIEMNRLDSSLDGYKKEFKYDFDNDIMLKYYPKRVIEKLVDGSFLELGLGHGYTIGEFLKKVKSYTVLDGSPAVIKNFITNEPELSKKVNIIQTYFETYETDQKFDNIMMGFILEHVEDPDIILEKYKKMLAKNGKIFISVPNAESLHRRFGFCAGYLNDLKQLSDADIIFGHRRYYNKSELLYLAKRHGLKILSIEGIFLKPLTTQQLQSLNLTNDIINAMLEVGKNYPELSNAILMELIVE